MAKHEDIYEQYASIIFRYLFSLTHEEHIAEELTQETFFQALKNINGYRGDSSIQVWLCAIAKRLWYKELNRRKKSMQINEYDLNLITDNTNIEKELQTQEKRIALYRAMQKLDTDTREVIHLRLAGEFSFKEIGEILNHTEVWARVRFYRGKEDLIHMLGGDENE